MRSRAPSFAALWVARRIFRESAAAASLVFAVVAWVSFATLLIVRQAAATQR